MADTKGEAKTSLEDSLNAAIVKVFSGELVGDVDALRTFRTNFGEFLSQLDMITSQSDKQWREYVEKLPEDSKPADYLDLFFRVPRGWAKTDKPKVNVAPTINLNLG
jgi:hypothetical protein